MVPLWANSRLFNVLEGTGRNSIWNLGLSAPTVSLTIWAPVWRAVFPAVYGIVNLKPVSQSFPPIASLNSATAFSRLVVYTGTAGSNPRRPWTIGPWGRTPLPA